MHIANGGYLARFRHFFNQMLPPRGQEIRKIPPITICQRYWFKSHTLNTKRFIKTLSAKMEVLKKGTHFWVPRQL